MADLPEPVGASMTTKRLPRLKGVLGLGDGFSLTLTVRFEGEVGERGLRHLFRLSRRRNPPRLSRHLRRFRHRRRKGAQSQRVAEHKHRRKPHRRRR